jgi:2-dehydro-3-deoxyphosphooctonate aldolase (KDO 8-P synthase)
MIPNIPGIKFASGQSFFLIAGPCVVENEKLVITVAEHVAGIAQKLQIPYIFKSSYKKANRSRLDSFMGIGDRQAMEIIRKVRETLGIPVLTDIHTIEEAKMAAGYVDVLQIPAFLCRQTELLVAAGETGKFVNIKKGQFLSPDAMKFAAEKIVSTGNHNIILTERGTTFGYQDLVVDFRSIPEMRKFGYPVVLDITHSLQQPNQSSGVTGGRPDLISTMARSGIAAGVDGIFLETHPEPAKALSDGANMLPLHQLEELLQILVEIRNVIL